MKRGDVYWAALRPRSGSEQSGDRPVVIVSNDGFNEVPTWRSIIVVPLSTSPRQAMRGATVVRIPKGTGGLRRECVAICHQVTTIDRSKLTTRLGTLPRTVIDHVGLGLRAAMDLYV